MITVVKANGQKEEFDQEKLRSSLLRAGTTDTLAEEVIKHITPELHDNMTTGEVYRHAFDILRSLSKPAARSYSLRRAIMDLGPSGFPFEDFVAEIMRAKGYEATTRQTVLGGCVPHEIDVVAWNAKQLIMIEAKFHNELGTKSDLKVVLYMKARFDDIANNVFDYGGNDRKVTQNWLVTNTKFSSTAIHYADCKKMTLVGWNYPEKGNLQDMVESEGLHPITCLSTLSDTDKKTLLSNNVVLCSAIHDDPDLLTKYLGESFKKDAVLQEISELYE